ncbi:GH3 family domain-containing protein [Gracilimonas sp.]|uniref:GH3 family domain-containing protein n=1 Tax=Gracilimonas sp. TaxID=1974203 RepID=UPI003D12C278
MEKAEIKYSFWPYVVYPGTMIISLGMFFVLMANGFELLASTYIPLTFGALSIIFFELYTPHQKEWIFDKHDVINDSLFMLTVQTILPKILSFLVAIFILRMLDYYELQITGLWPHHWSMALQVILMVLIADFFRYWLHKFSHEIPFLWKFHAVHHSPKKLYWLNVGRFHPVEKALQFLGDAMPFIIVGVSEEVLALYFVFYAVNGFFQHCNIELEMGPLNYVISGPQLHRWHHSRKIEESNTNYGNNIIIWDILFGTYFFPKHRLVDELGLLNKEYPLDYLSQLKTPFSGEIDKKALPLQGISGMILNTLLKFKMKWIQITLYNPLKELARSPEKVQKETLSSILFENKNTVYGKEYNFDRITGYESYREKVPVSEYEDIRDLIEKQDLEKTTSLTAESPLFYNQTSGTTGQPKYLPVLKRTLASLRKTQQIFSLVQYTACPEAFYGKIIGLVSPAIEGHMPSGTPFGSASGHIYNTMPWLARKKYVIPKEVFQIKDYEIKYYIVCRLMIEEKDVTYLGSANPSSFHKLLDVINQNFGHICNDIASGTCKYLRDLDPRIITAVNRRLKPNAKRAEELAHLFSSGDQIAYEEIWPYLKLLITWTGGSCGISLKSVLPKFRNDIRVIDLGYLSSELRATVTINPDTNEGVPTIGENFFEFVHRDDWENDRPDFKTIGSLEQGEQYYIFVTTPTGLYRYNMNDIVEISGKFENTPTFRFIQKGKGVTNITGEKLYVSQVINAVKKAEQELDLDFRFYQMLADEKSSLYELYIEPGERIIPSISELSRVIDTALQEQNIEYKTKRESDRLQELNLHILAHGCYESYKDFYLKQGQREGQFKPQILQYKSNFDFKIQEFIAE